MKALTLIVVVLMALASGAEAKQRHSHRHHSHFISDFTAQLLPHPAGCPRIAFCGCGARKDLGLSDPRLNLAWNWTRFYHGSTQVAVWRHHVAIIEQWTGSRSAILRDYNSGGHLSRRHERSLAGAKIVGGSSLAYVNLNSVSYP